jgi:hypothetical protein
MLVIFDVGKSAEILSLSCQFLEMYSYQLLTTLEVETSIGSGSLFGAELVGQLGASLVTTALRAYRPRMEETVSSYGR